jgi:hypothetical protein
MDENPYKSPLAGQGQPMSRDERILRLMLKQLKHWQARPPTFLGLLFSRRTLLLAVAGVVFVSIFVNVGMPSEACYLGAGMFLGAIFREIGWNRRVVLSWRFQEGLMDWDKINAYAVELGV